MLVVSGSVVMILGALAVSTAVATEREHASTHDALLRECDRYQLDYAAGAACVQRRRTAAAIPLAAAWWDYVILLCAVGVFVWLGVQARVPALGMNLAWTGVLAAALVVTAVDLRLGSVEGDAVLL